MIIRYVMQQTNYEVLSTAEDTKSQELFQTMKQSNWDPINQNTGAFIFTSVWWIEFQEPILKNK